MPSRAQRVVILDRDGVLDNPVWDEADGRHEGPLRAADVALAPGALEGCKLLQAAGWTLAVASNQPGAAKGKTTPEDVQAVHERVVELLGSGGVRIDTWHYCHHHPRAIDPALRAVCGCRKPRPGMLLDILCSHGADAHGTWMVGDADSDVQAARAAGCCAMLVEHPCTAHRRTETACPDARAPDLQSAADAILRTGSVWSRG